ncbi:dihydrolipoyl dehydrogenase family protein [Benzoatithermus flavus]|uniref:FAD-dependent oxidoreductase n=1 Tax=Benzoatithermus flavus TaxID=3108223 RepID=A0ABU8XQV7_9PROT
MSQILTPDLCVIGAGSGGLSVAAGAVQMGASVVLVERHRMGGDCLNYGCVPSKSLLAAAAAAEAMRQSGSFGVRPVEPGIDFAAVRRHVRDVIAGIAPHDSIERFTGLGVTVLLDHARFTGPDQVIAGGRRIRARRFVVATGSRPAIPPIPGLAEIPHLTNENVFDLAAPPRHLLVLGGGPIGCELAQAFRRLGSEVTVIDLGPILPKDDPELTAVVRERLLAEGVRLHERVRVVGAEPGPALVVESAAGRRRLDGSHLLVAVGRTPVIEDLGLEAAGIAFDRKGIKVDSRLRTTNARVFAIGDVAGGPQFTHLANHHASVVVKNALFRLPARATSAAIPRVTYTDPELAVVGTSEAEAKEQGLAHEVLRAPFADNDRARAERRTEGLVKLVVGKRGRVLGAGIVGAHAGELILPWVLALDRRLPLSAVAGVVTPYPTLSEASKRAAASWYAPRLFGGGTRRLVRLLARLG